MWYWVVMAVLVIGCIALLSGTFFSIKKNKAEEAAERQKPERKSGRAREMQKKHSSRERDGKEQMVDGRAARVQRTGGSRMHRHVGKKHAGCRQSREKSGKTPPVESNPGRPGFVDKVQFYFLQ